MEKLNCVLLVDDDVINNAINERLLKELGITSNVRTALDGEEALLYLSKNCSPYDYNYPDLILLDYQMPHMQGNEFMELFNRINSSHRHRSKIIMLSSFLTEDIKKQLLSLGVENYIAKPLTEDKLKNILREV